VLPTAGRLASNGITNHVALRLKFQGVRGVLATKPVPYFGACGWISYPSRRVLPVYWE